MCGIVGGILREQTNIVPDLYTGLSRLAYRGYDSAGMAVMHDKKLERVRAAGKISVLEEAILSENLQGHIGISHTRWATHGVPSLENAHPHMSHQEVAVVHNGIIENYEVLRNQLQKKGYIFETETDTEVIAHYLHDQFTQGATVQAALSQALRDFEGAYAFLCLWAGLPETVMGVCAGCPLVLGIAENGYYLASDSLAVLPFTSRCVYLVPGDMIQLDSEKYTIFSQTEKQIQREEKILSVSVTESDKGDYAHFMQKEIFEQPTALRATIEQHCHADKPLSDLLMKNNVAFFQGLSQVHIVACGTSYHAAYVAKYWLESIAKIQCSVEIASEFRYREKVIPEGTLFISISQSGETADTLAALRQAKTLAYVAYLAICNVIESALVRESDLLLATYAGPEIGVASTKAFTTQLAALFLLSIAMAAARNKDFESQIYLTQLYALPDLMTCALQQDKEIQLLAKHLLKATNALFLGRGLMYPIALEGALKLKEISYIHAEAYPAGELKHGPLALVDDNMPVVLLAPSNDLLEKIKSNAHEISARKGKLMVLTDQQSGFSTMQDNQVLYLPQVHPALAPILYTIPLQLLAYHTAVFMGTDLDQPRNLAKSVTVE